MGNLAVREPLVWWPVPTHTMTCILSPAALAALFMAPSSTFRMWIASFTCSPCKSIRPSPPRCETGFLHNLTSSGYNWIRTYYAMIPSSLCNSETPRTKSWFQTIELWNSVWNVVNNRAIRCDKQYKEFNLKSGERLRIGDLCRYIASLAFSWAAFICALYAWPFMLSSLARALLPTKYACLACQIYLDVNMTNSWSIHLTNRMVNSYASKLYSRTSNICYYHKQKENANVETCSMHLR